MASPALQGAAVPGDQALRPGGGCAASEGPAMRETQTSKTREKESIETDIQASIHPYIYTDLYYIDIYRYVCSVNVGAETTR